MSQYPTDSLSTPCTALTPLELMVSGPGREGSERQVFEQPFVLIGRDSRSSLRLDDDGVSRRHAYLQQLGERVFCIDLGSRMGTRWGEEARAAGWVRPEEGIQIGPFLIELANPTWAGAALDEGVEAGDPLQDRMNSQAQMLRFNIAFGDEMRTQFRMNRELVLVGTGPDCRIRLRDPNISQYHCSLVRTPEGIWVIDLLSRTGTSLNGQLVRWAQVKEGDRLQVGPYVLSLVCEDRSTARTSFASVENRAELPGQPAEEAAQSGPISPSAPALQAELDQLREQLRDSESLHQQLADREAECARLREQIQALEIQVAEIDDLKNRLEITQAEAQKLGDVRIERDLWQDQAQTLQNQQASDLAEREELRQRLEEADSATEQLRQQLQGTESQLADLETVRDECTRLRDETQSLEIQIAEIAELKLRLESAEADAQKLEEVRNEHDRLQSEKHELHSQIASHSTEREELRQRLEEAQQQLADTRSKHDSVAGRIPDLEDKAASAERLSDRLREAEAATEQLRQQLRGAESQLADLETLRTECTRLRDQTQALEVQIAEIADLKSRLESAEADARKLEEVRNEHDRLQSEKHELHNQIASHSTEREELRQRLEEVHQQLAQESEAVRAANARLDRQSADLLRLPETQEELARTLDATRELQTKLDEALAHQRDSEALRHQLADSRIEYDRVIARTLELEARAASADGLQGRLHSAGAEMERLRQQLRESESRAAETADLKARLESAEANAGKLEEISRERDHWQAQTQTLSEKIASQLIEREHFDRVTAELHNAKAERDRLLAEQQTSAHRADQATARVSELESKLAEATTANERSVAEERARWESERQELEAQLKQARETQSQTDAADQAMARVAELEHELAEAVAANGTGAGEERACWESERQELETLLKQARAAQSQAEAVARDLHSRAAIEREEGKRRLEGAEGQIVWERGLFQEQSEQLRRQVSALRAERDRLVAQFAQAEMVQPGAQQPSAQRPSPAAANDPTRQMAVQDLALAQIFGIRLEHSLEPVARLQSPMQQPAMHNPPGAGIDPESKGRLDSGIGGNGENQSVGDAPPAVQADAESASPSSEDANGEATIAEEKSAEGDLQPCPTEWPNEEPQGFLRKVFNIVRRKQS